MTLFNRAQARTLFVTLCLCAAAAVAQGKPKIALYIAGDSLKQGDKSMLSRKFLSPFTASGLYNIIDRSDSFNEKVDAERKKQMSGSVNERDVVRIGAEFGAKYVCIVELDYGLGRWNIGARMVDVETAEIYLQQGETDIVGALDKADFSGAAKTVFEQIHGKRSGGGSDGGVTQIQQPIQQSYPQQGYPQQGYPQQGYPQQGYPQQGYHQQPNYQNFTAGERWGTFGLNWLVPGAGSFAIMKDITGGVVQLVLVGSGYAFVLSGDEEPALIGVGLLLSNFIYNIVRSSSYSKKPPRQYGGMEDAGLKWAILPDENGGVKTYLAYSADF